MRFDELPRFVDSGHYCGNVSWNYLESMLKGYDIRFSLIMNSDFQRGHVWDTSQQIDFVEYALQGGKSGKDVWFNCVGWMGSFEGPFVLVDGLQRITAVLLFKQNKFPIFKKYYFKDFVGTTDICIPNFVFHVNGLDSRSEVLKWYIELNSGGVVHSKEEIDRVKELLDTEAQG